MGEHLVWRDYDWFPVRPCTSRSFSSLGSLPRPRRHRAVTVPPPRAAHSANFNEKVHKPQSKSYGRIGANLQLIFLHIGVVYKLRLQNLASFYHLPPFVYIYYGMKFYKSRFFDHLPPSSCKCSLWTALYLMNLKTSISASQLFGVWGIPKDPYWCIKHI